MNYYLGILPLCMCLLVYEFKTCAGVKVCLQSTHTFEALSTVARASLMWAGRRLLWAAPVVPNDKTSHCCHGNCHTAPTSVGGALEDYVMLL